MPFGMVLALACGVILLASALVKVAFKRRLVLDTRRILASRDAQSTGLTRALRVSSPLAIILSVTALGLGWWGWWRVQVTLYGQLDIWMIWVFNLMFGFVAVQLLLAISEPRIVGDNERRRMAVLVPLYNEDPAVVRHMLAALFHQSILPAEVHVVDDGSTTGDYAQEQAWFLDRARQLGVMATWTRTLNRGKRHAQVTAFQQIRGAEFFVTVDSDSALDFRALEELARPFHDPKVMSVAGIILAQNHQVNLLARVTDLIFVTQQLVDRSAMSRLGSVLVNSGGLAAYRVDVLKDKVSEYLSETYLGRAVVFSDDSFLTLLALLKGKTVQQPSAFALAYMPDRFGHHVRQQLRWFRGSFIRGLWRVRYLPIGSWGWWRQALGWIQLVAVTSVFVYLVAWRPIFEGRPVPLEAFLVPLAIGFVQHARYLGIWRSDTSNWQRYGALLLSPLATLWSMFILRPLRLWGICSSRKLGWNTRQSVEVSRD